MADRADSNLVIERADEPLGTGAVIWLAAVLFVAVFYLTGIAEVAWASRAFDYLGQSGPYVAFGFTAAAIYTAALLGSWAYGRSFDMPRSIRAMAERTGTLIPDVLLAISVITAATAIGVSANYLFVPLVIAVAVPAIGQLFYGRAERPVMGLPVLGAPSGAHYWRESELPVVDERGLLPEGYRLERFEWEFSASLSESIHLEHDLVYSLMTQADLQELFDCSRRTGHDLLRDMIATGVTREIMALAGTIRATSWSRDHGVLDEGRHCVAVAQQRCPLVVGEAPTAAPSLSVLDALIDGRATPETRCALIATLLLSLGHEVVLVEMDGDIALGLAGADGLPGSYVTHEDAAYFFVGPDEDGNWTAGDIPACWANRIMQTRGARRDPAEGPA